MAHTIPVAFNVQASSEDEAARILADILVAARLTMSHRAEDGHDDDAALGPIECWWMPNHRDADGSDNEYRFVFVPDIVPDEVVDAAVDRYQEENQ